MALTSPLRIDAKLLILAHIIGKLQVVAELLASRREAIQGVQLRLHCVVALECQHLSVISLGKDLLPSPGELNKVVWQFTHELLVDEHGIIDHVVAYDGPASLPQSLYHPREAHLPLEIILNRPSLFLS